MLTANVRTRVSVAFVSSRNVGKILIESASASRRAESSPKSSSLRCTSVLSAPSSGVICSNVLPAFLHEIAQRDTAVVEHVGDALGVLGEHRQVAERVAQVAPAAGAGLGGARLPL